jgi:hypothetical protein
VLRTPKSNLARRKVVMQTPSLGDGLDVVLRALAFEQVLAQPFGHELAQPAAMGRSVISSSGVSLLGPVQEKPPVWSMVYPKEGARGGALAIGEWLAAGDWVPGRRLKGRPEKVKSPKRGLWKDIKDLRECRSSVNDGARYLRDL